MKMFHTGKTVHQKSSLKKQSEFTEFMKSSFYLGNNQVFGKGERRLFTNIRLSVHKFP